MTYTLLKLSFYNKWNTQDVDSERWQRGLAMSCCQRQRRRQHWPARVPSVRDPRGRRSVTVLCLYRYDYLPPINCARRWMGCDAGGGGAESGGESRDQVAGGANSRRRKQVCGASDIYGISIYLYEHTHTHISCKPSLPVLALPPLRPSDAPIAPSISRRI